MTYRFDRSWIAICWQLILLASIDRRWWNVELLVMNCCNWESVLFVVITWHEVSSTPGLTSFMKIGFVCAGDITPYQGAWYILHLRKVYMQNLFATNSRSFLWFFTSSELGLIPFSMVKLQSCYGTALAHFINRLCQLWDVEFIMKSILMYYIHHNDINVLSYNCKGLHHNFNRRHVSAWLLRRYICLGAGLLCFSGTDDKGQVLVEMP